MNSESPESQSTPNTGRTTFEVSQKPSTKRADGTPGETKTPWNTSLRKQKASVGCNMSQDRRSETSRKNLADWIQEPISDEPTVSVAVRVPQSMADALDKARKAEAPAGETLTRSGYLRAILGARLQAFGYAPDVKRDD